MAGTNSAYIVPRTPCTHHPNGITPPAGYEQKAWQRKNRDTIRLLQCDHKTAVNLQSRLITFIFRAAGVFAGLSTILGCAYSPPLETVVETRRTSEQQLELGAVFWADRVRHTSNTWQKHSQTFSFRLENIPASQVLELLSTELQLGYEMDACGESLVSLVGRNMPLQQVIESLEIQAGAAVSFQGQQLSLRCEADQLRVYTLDYLSIARQMNDTSSLSSAIAGSSRDLPTDRRDTGNRSELTLNNTQQHDIWQELAAQIEQIIQVQVKPVELTTRESVVDQDEDRAHASTRPTKAPRSRPGLNSATQVSRERRELTTSRKETRSGRVVVNPESGTVSVIARPSQHRRVAQWLEQVQRRVDRQIVIEAVITEISLNDRYERGIDWNVLRQNGITAGLAVQGLNLVNPALALSALKSSSGSDTNIVLKLLEEFGRAEVLSSPRVVTMNQQAAVLKVIDNRVYFTTDVQTSAPTQNSPAFSTFTTQVQTVPVGFLMTVTPQISDNNAIQLRVRPTLSRIVGFVQDPNPALQQLNIVSRIPEVQTRELESILRLKSGEMALLGGLRQREFSKLNRGIPGTPALLDLVTQSENQQQNHIELIILLKATVLDSATAEPTPQPGPLRELDNALSSSLTLYQAGQTAAAQALLKLLSTQYPQAPEPSYNMAILLARQGHSNQALDHLEQAEKMCAHQNCALPLLTVRALIQAQLP
jgi:MSHA biogenesis protein MshL